MSSICLSQGFGLEWAISATDTIERARAVECMSQVVDNDGNLFVIGTLEETADFDPSPNEFNLTSRSDHEDLFLAKYDSLNNFIWAKGIGGRGIEQVSSLAIDASGNVVFVGQFRGKLFYDAAQDTNFIDISYVLGQNVYWPYHGYLIKYDSNGNLIWANAISTFHTAFPSEAAIDSDNNIIVTGKFKYQAHFGDNYQDTLYSDGTWDIFFAKYDSLGQYLWSHSIGGTGDDEGRQVAIDNANNIYISGIIQDTVDMDPSPAVALETATNHHFLAKYNTSGAYSWSHCYNTGSITINDVQIDNSNNIVFTGKNAPGGYLEKRDTSGNLVWFQQITGNTDLPKYLTVDSSNDIFVTGDHDAFASYDNLFISKYDSSGNQLFLNLIEGVSFNDVSGISLISDEKPVITGYFLETTDFDPSSGTFNLATLNSPSSNFRMGFVARYNNNGTIDDAFSIGNHYFYSVSQGGYTDFGARVTLDSDKSAYVSGIYASATDFDPSANEAILTTVPTSTYPGTTSYRSATFIAKYDSSSNYQWAIKIDSTYNAVPTHVTDSSDDLYFATTLYGSTDIDPSSNTLILTSTLESGLIIKYDKNGNLIWGFILEPTTATSISTLRNIVLDTSENILISGTFNGTVNFNPLGSAVLNTSSSAGNNFFLAKYDANGILIWFKGMTGVPAGKVQLTNANEFIIVGTGSGIFDFDPSPSVYSLNLLPSAFYMAKYSDQGDFQWANSFNGPGLESVCDVEVGDDHFYVLGKFEDSIDLDPSPLDSIVVNQGGFSTFLARYNISDGNFNWGFAFDGAGAANNPHALDLDENENIAVYGNFAAGYGYSPYPTFFDLDPSVDTAAFMSNDGFNSGVWSGFVAIYDSLGSYIWATNFPGGQGSTSDNLGDVYLDDEQLIVTGSFEYHTDFTPSNISNPLISRSRGDLFLAKFEYCTTKYTYDTLTVCGSHTWHNQAYTTSGDYTKMLPQFNGCDSIIYLNLTVFPIDTTTLFVTECDSFTWDNGTTYYSGGLYSPVLTGTSGCDSIALLDLFIPTIDTAILTVSECDSYTWTNGVNYTSSGIYSQTLSTSSGCDSISALYLTINSTSSSSSVISSCGTYLANNGNTYSSSGTYIDTLVNSFGCDSISELNLTILSNDSSFISVAECNDSYTWTNGITYFVDGVYNQVLTNSSGCDSIVELDLTLLTISTAAATLASDTSIICSNPGVIYQWIDCATQTTIQGANSQTFIPTYNSLFAVVITDGSCSDTSNCVEIVSVGLEEIENHAIHLYPNPTNGMIFIDFDEVQDKLYVNILDASGRQVFEMDFSNTNKIELDFDFANGLYFLNIQDAENSTRQYKVIKE